MSIKKYGIYLSYAPGVDLRHEGLGRYLAAFLKGTSSRSDVRFVLVCPSWSRKSLEALFASEGVLKEQFEMLSPSKEPLILRFYEALNSYKRRAKKIGFSQRILEKAAQLRSRVTRYVEDRFIKSESFFELLPIFFMGLVGVLLGLILSPILLLGIVYLLFIKAKSRVKKLLVPYLRQLSRIRAAFGDPKEDAFILRLYQGMEYAESERMLKLVNGLHDVQAWYSPTAFWPAFNKIQKPRLMCVPDVVLADFSVGFSTVAGNRFLKVFQAVEEAIYSGQHFVTYSDAVKWETLVARYSVHASNVSVVHHAPNSLSQWVGVVGTLDADKSSISYSHKLLRSALAKSFNPTYSAKFANESVGFLFYASQFRPNKNVLSLLKAYEYLLRGKFIGHKLIMTGNPNGMPEIKNFIKDNFLENDVLCLHGLTVQELAACYKLAVLAVNPTLSEGGCPFTFTEALSVGTPVAMSRIPVAEEVLDDEKLQELTLFNPYDWKDIASHIEFSLKNRQEILSVQQDFYKKLSLRTWGDVVNEHVDILDRISTAADASAERDNA